MAGVQFAPSIPRTSKVWLLRGACAISAMAIAAAPLRAQSPAASVNAALSDQCDRQIVRGELGRQIDQYLERAVPFGFSGSVFVMDSSGLLLHRAYGLANLSRGTRNRIDTLFDMGSITKAFTADAIALLESEGRLSFNQPLSVYFPNAPADKRNITIEQLLTHTAGLIDLTNENDYLVISRDEFVRDLFNSPLIAPPGSRWSYSNAGYSVLSAIIEIVSGLPYEQFLRDRILLPSNMRDTGYRLARWSNDRGDRSAHTYTPPVDHGSPVGRLRPSKGPHWILLGNGGMITTTIDLCRFELALRRGRPIPPNVQATLFAGRVQQRPSLKQGYAWSEETLPEGVAVHHGGDAPLFGLNAEFRRYPERRVTIGILANTRIKGASTRRAVVPAMARILFGGDAPSPPQVRAVSAASLAPLEGEYAVSDGARFVVRRTGGRLTIGAMGQDAADLLAFQRVPASMAARRQRNTMAEEFARAIMASDAAALHGFIADPKQVDRLMGDMMRAQESYGRLEGIRGLGTVRLDKGVFRTTMLFNFARAPKTIRFAWSGKQVGVDTDDEDLPSVGGVMATSPIAAAVEEPMWQDRRGGFAIYDLFSNETRKVEFQRGGSRQSMALIVHLPSGPVRAVRVQ